MCLPQPLMETGLDTKRMGLQPAQASCPTHVWSEQSWWIWVLCGGKEMSLGGWEKNQACSPNSLCHSNPGHPGTERMFLWRRGRRWRGAGSCRRPLSLWSPYFWEGAGRVGVWAARQGPLTSGVSQNHQEGVGSRLAVGRGARHTELDPKQSERGPGGELGNPAFMSYRGGSSAHLVLLLRDKLCAS